MKIHFEAKNQNTGISRNFHTMEVLPKTHRNVNKKDLIKCLKVRDYISLTLDINGITIEVPEETVKKESNKSLLYRDVNYILNTIEALGYFLESNSNTFTAKIIIKKLVKGVISNYEVCSKVSPQIAFMLIDEKLNEIISNVEFKDEENRIILFLNNKFFDSYNWDRFLHGVDTAERYRIKGHLLKELFNNKLIPEFKDFILNTVCDNKIKEIKSYEASVLRQLS